MCSASSPSPSEAHQRSEAIIFGRCGSEGMSIPTCPITTTHSFHHPTVKDKAHARVQGIFLRICIIMMRAELYICCVLGAASGAVSAVLAGPRSVSFGCGRLFYESAGCFSRARVSLSEGRAVLSRLVPVRPRTKPASPYLYMDGCHGEVTEGVCPEPMKPLHRRAPSMSPSPPPCQRIEVRSRPPASRASRFGRDLLVRREGRAPCPFRGNETRATPELGHEPWGLVDRVAARE